MDRVEKPPLSHLSGQLKMGIVGGRKRETIWEDLALFGRDLLFYLYRRIFGFVSYWLRFLFSGFTLTEQLKTWLSRRFIRRKGQLAFPFAHVTLAGVSLSLLVLTTGLGSFIFENTEPILDDLGAAILSDNQEYITEESLIGSTKGTTHEVGEGETLYSIAQTYNRTVDDLVFANPEQVEESFDKNGTVVYRVRVGDILAIPPIEGRDYEVKPGDTLLAVAQHFNSNAQQIAELNYIMSTNDLYKYITANKDIYPDGKIIVPLPRSYTAGSFTIPEGACRDIPLGYPTQSGLKIGDFTSGHQGVDFAAAYGEELLAVADGRVSALSTFSKTCLNFSSGCNYGYGGFVFIDIGDGYQARYGHTSKILVGVGEEVKKGQPVALAGDSGVAFGPHLHFELYCGGISRRVNPYILFE